MIIALTGPPGAGKGTQSNILAKRHGFVTFSVGEILRHSTDPELLKVMNAGDLVDPAMVVKIVIDKICEYPPGQNLVTDGFPRNLDQVSLFEKGLSNVGRQLDGILYLTISREVSDKRLDLRATQAHRADDDPHVRGERWRVFNSETIPAIEYYRQKGQVHEVDGEGSVEEVAKRVEQSLGLN